MFIFGNFLAALASILNMLLSVYWWIIVARAVISWINPDPYNPIVRFLHSATEPLLYRVRRLIPLNFGGVDFSPILVFVVIIFLQRFLVQSLLDLASRLQ